jgi:hypothetical protein
MLVAAVGEPIDPVLVDVVGVGVAPPPQATVSASSALTKTAKYLAASLYPPHV